MARVKKSQVETVIPEGEIPVEEQTELFPELDTSNPEQKELLRFARQYAKAKAERDALLTTHKEKVDGLASKLCGKMHACNILKFRYDGTSAELIQRSEKVIVKTGDGDSDDEE